MRTIFVVAKVETGDAWKIIICPVNADDEREACETIQSNGWSTHLAFSRELWFLLYQKYDVLEYNSFMRFSGSGRYDAKLASYAIFAGKEKITDYLERDDHDDYLLLAEWSEPI